MLLFDVYLCKQNKNKMISRIQYLDAVKIVNQYLMEQAPPALENIPSIYKHRMDDADLSVRVYNCLKDKNIIYLEELSAYTKDDLFFMRNFGQHAFRELKKCMDDNKIFNNWEY